MEQGVMGDLTPRPPLGKGREPEKAGIGNAAQGTNNYSIGVVVAENDREGKPQGYATLISVGDLITFEPIVEGLQIRSDFVPGSNYFLGDEVYRAYRSQRPYKTHLHTLYSMPYKTAARLINDLWASDDWDVPKIDEDLLYVLNKRGHISKHELKRIMQGLAVVV